MNPFRLALRVCYLILLVPIAGPDARAQNAPPGTPVQYAVRGPEFYMVAGTRGERIDARNAESMRQRIVLRLQNATIPDALTAIAEQSGLQFAYRRELLPPTVRVSLKADDITVAGALTVVLLDASCDVQLAPSGLVSLVSRPSVGGKRTRAVQGGSTVSGRVVDAVTKAPLDQVAVRIEGLGLGAVSTSDGRYTVRGVSPGTYHVTARRVGYTPLTTSVTVATDSTTTADFALAAAPTRLNEMVTTAVGDQRRYEVGNVISTINADSIAPTAPITSLTDLISARAPGVEVKETGGLTGSGETIRIRGQSSLVLQGDPIVIVDGVRQDNTPGSTATLPLAGMVGPATPSPSRLNDVDFGDIQSIDVLKGPAASTEYGTDAANGVIVITTKHGTSGRPRWHASAEETAGVIPERFPALYHSWGHTTDASRAPVACPLVPFFSTYGSAVGTCAVDSVTAWDVLNQSAYSIYGTGSRQKYNLSASGGSDAVRYFVAGNLSNETGVLQLPNVLVSQANAIGLPRSEFKPNGEDQRSVRANTAVRLGPTLDMTVTGAYLSTYQHSPNAQLLDAEVFARGGGIRDSAHAYGYGSFPTDNPVYQFGLPTSQATDRLTGGLTANWRPVSWFVGHGIVGVDHGSQRATAAILPQIAPLYPFAGTPAQLGVANGTTDIYTVDLRGSATAALTPAMRAVTSVGLQLADTRTQGTTAVASGITATNLTVNGAVNPTVTQLANRQATLGGYGEEQLGLWDRLFVTGAIRIDAGSGFGRAYNTAVYPKASLSWLALNSGPTTVRLRGAFGESGIQPPNGAALQLYAPMTDWLNGGFASTVAVANVQNRRLQPERSAEYEGGVDIGLWQSRVSVELTGYSKTTRNALVSAGTGWEAGGFPYEENVGKVRNAGVEGAVTAALVQARALTWDVTVNASINRNKLLSLAPGVPLQQLAGAYAVYRFVSGYPLYGYWSPQEQYADLNHDGVIEPNEITVADTLSYAGSSSPTREASLSTHVGLWGGAVTVSALADYRGGFRLLNTTAFFAMLGQSDRASNDRAAPLWQQARDVGGELIFADGLDGYDPPKGFYEDATYVRVRELALTYAMPRAVGRALRVSTVSVTGAVRNLALWTRYSGTDPEVANSFGVNAQLSPTSNTYLVNNNVREDAGAVPLLRYWVVRLNVGF